MMGLIDAANKFDPDKNILFKTFAEYRIKGAILDEMRKLDWFSRSLRDKQSRLSRTMAGLEQKLGRSPDEKEMANALDMSLPEYQDLLSEVSHLGCVSLHETLDHSGDRPAEWSFVNTKVSDILNRYYYEHTKRRPMVLPFMVKV